MRPYRPRLQVLAAGRDITDRCDSIVFSATDQGGFEIATLGQPAVDRPDKGASIVIRSGLDVAWQGRVAEVSDHSQHQIATKTTGCEGLVALMRDNPMQMIYVDRDNSKWGDASNLHQQALLSANTSLGSSSVATDPTGSNPAVVQSITDSWAAPNLPTNESWYDAGPGNLIAKVYFNVADSQAGVPNWTDRVALSSDDLLTVSVNSGNVIQSSGYFAPASAATTPYRFALLNHFFTVTPAGVQGATYNAYWQNPAVYGNHGLTGAGSDPVGFYPSDIATHALTQVKGGISPGVIIPSFGYIAPHVTYPQPTTPDVIVDDMAKLMGWSWGVWPPPSILSSQPRMDFGPPPTDATCVISKSECDQLDVTSRLGDLYTTAIITYTDAAGTAGQATVTLPNAGLSEAGITGRTLVLDIGLGSAAAAQAFGYFALALSQSDARAAGQATLPASVRLIGGGSKPSHLIRPGIDRLRILDLRDSGPLLDQGTVRRDVFRVKRIETTVAKDGSVASVVELDSGRNLLETLQARMALAAGVVGSGASGG